MNIVTVNSLSGGRTSSYMAVKYPADVNVFAVVCIEDCPEHLTDPAILRYARDKFEKYCPNYPDFIATAEDDRTLLAMMELEQFIGKEIVWVRGESFDNLIANGGRKIFGGASTRLPSWARRYCTTEMKLLPIFEYLYFAGLLPCHMNIGFRSDEPKRIENFYAPGKNGHHFHYPVNCRTYGEKKQNWESIYYRRAHFPLFTDGTTSDTVNKFWEGKIDFPKISNCEFCFHKNLETIALMCRLSPTKLPWWKSQEEKGKGTWRDDNITYETISKSRLAQRLDLFEQNVCGCTSEGCTS